MANDYPINPENEYLGITEAAEYLRISASTLRRWEKKGFLVPERTPTGIRRYTKRQLDEVIQAPTDHHAYSAPVQAAAPAPIQTQAVPSGMIDDSTYVLSDQNTSDLAWNTIAPTEGGSGEAQQETGSPINDFSAGDEYVDQEEPASVAPASDDEVDQLRDFFKRAGYEAVPEIEPIQPFTPSGSVSAQQTQAIESVTKPMPIAAQEPTHDSLPHSSIAPVSHTQPPSTAVLEEIKPFQGLSLADITKEHAKDSSDLSTFLAPKPQETQKIEHAPSFRDQHFSQSEKLDFNKATQSNRIEVFHEEHSVDTPAHLPEVNQPKSSFRQSANEPQRDADRATSRENSYHVDTPKEQPTKKNVVPIILVSVVVVILLGVGGWFVFSALSAPEPLYSPIVE